MTDTQDLSIAIIGMAGRFPGADDVEQFWRNLRDGVESIRFFGDELEESIAGRAGRRDDPHLVRAGGLLDGIEGFDAAFFDFNPREAELTDPQQRVFLECCWQALERAGYSPEGFAGAIGVFGGTGMSTYFFHNVLSHPELLQTLAPLQIVIGVDKDYLASRVSYKLNLKGPSISVQTACSTSLVAVHLACQSLQDYQSDLALAGGVSIQVPQKAGYRYQEGGILSPDGHCRAFDRKAGGTVFSSGAGVVVLKRLADALADGDTILAVIRGSAVNNDGAAKVGFTAPSVEGQVAVISEALAAAGVSGDTIGYVEAHGTGTALGDPIEVTPHVRSFGVGAARPGTAAAGRGKSQVCHGREDAVAALRSRQPQRLLSLDQEERERPVVFLFPGQGAQHVNMGKDLYDAEPAFRRALDTCARLLQPHLGLDLRTVLFAEAGAAAAGRLEQTALAQPALFAVEYALAELLREWGIRPAAMLGHSIGEYVAACLAGVFSLEDALALVAARGRLMQELPAGAMLVVPRPEAETRRLLTGGLSLAAVNGPSLAVVSGPAGEVDALARGLAEQGIEARRLHTSHAFHSAMMDPILEAFAREVAKVRLAAPRVPYVANLTGTWIEAAQSTDPAWWVRQLRETVRFAGGAAELLQDRSRVLLEVGPGRTLASLVRAAAPERAVVTTMRHPQDGDSGGGSGEPLANALGRLWLAGARVDWEGVHAHERRRRVPLPTYPFERQRFWLEPAPRLRVAAAAPAAAASPETVAVPAAAPSRAHARPGLATPFVPPADEVESAVVALWERALGIAGIGVHDDFFELGGHSLLATQITAEVRSAFAIDAPLKTLFETPTAAGLAAAVRSHRGEEGAAGAAPALPVLVPDPGHRHEPFPLTDVQQAYWIGRSGVFEMGEVATHVYTEIDSRGVDLDRMTLAWRLLIERHDMLRAIVLPDGRQQILETVPPYRIAVVDLRGADAPQREAGLQRVRQAMSHQVLPSDRWPLFEVRATLLDGGVGRFHVSFDFLIGDAWSWQVLMRDLARLYADPAAELPPLTVSFRDYVLALADYERTPGFARDLDYWRGRLADLPPAPELPLARSPASLGRPRFVRHAGHLPRAAWSRLKERASRSGLTPSGVLLAAFSEVLAAWSKSPRFTINLTLFNRLPLHPQVNELIGDFTSLTLLAVDASQAGGFEARARRTQAQLWEDLDHRTVSGVRVLRELARGHGGAARSFMPVVFTSTLNIGSQGSQGSQQDGTDGPGAEDEPRDDGRYEISQTPQVWLDHQVREGRGRLLYNWDVVADLFPPGLIEAMFAAFRELLGRLAAAEADNAAWASDAFDLLPAAQRDEQAAANATAEDFGAAACGLLHALAAGPDDRPAVPAPRRTPTYRELHREARALGHRLRALGARPNRLVAVVMEKGWEQVVGVLGVLGSGAAYLPVDPDLPADRRRYLLENGEVEIAVTQPWLDDRFAERGEWPAGMRRLRVEAR